jgi:polyhydroxyalkanoate synthesis regulator phasin
MERIMEETLSIAQAARRLGIPRATLQARIQNGDVPCFEGRVHLDALKASFPEASELTASPDLERMQFIMDHAFMNRVQTAHLPDIHSAMGQIRRLRMDVRQLTEKNQAYRLLITELTEQLRAAQERCDQKQRRVLDDMIAWIAGRMDAANELPGPRTAQRG